MTDLTFVDSVHTSTMHRADAPVGRAARFRLRKRFGDLPCCHRSWSRQDKRYFLHGYERLFDVEFACAEMDPETELVVDGHYLKEVRATLRGQFDHTTLIAADDPQLDLFEQLADQGVIDLGIMQCTGIEASAAWVFDTVELIVGQATGGRVWVSRVEAREDRNNVFTLTASN